VVRYLVDRKEVLAHIDDVDSDNYTPAMIAASSGELAILKFLIDDKHANTTITNSKGKNLLHMASSNLH